MTTSTYEVIDNTDKVVGKHAYADDAIEFALDNYPDAKIIEVITERGVSFRSNPQSIKSFCNNDQLKEYFGVSA